MKHDSKYLETFWMKLVQLVVRVGLKILEDGDTLKQLYIYCIHGLFFIEFQCSNPWLSTCFIRTTLGYNRIQYQGSPFTMRLKTTLLVLPRSVARSAGSEGWRWRWRLLWGTSVKIALVKYSVYMYIHTSMWMEWLKTNLFQVCLRWWLAGCDQIYPF